MKTIDPAFLSFATLALLVASTGSALAMCQINNPECSIPYHVTYDWGTVNGNTLNQVVNSAVTVQSYPSDNETYSGATGGTLTAFLTDSQVSLTATTFNGQSAYDLYLMYSPTSDAGSFVISATGDLLSGDKTAWTRIRNEIRDADPNFFNSLNAIPLSWWQQTEGSYDSLAMQPNIRSIGGCAAWGVLDAAAIFVSIDPVTWFVDPTLFTWFGPGMVSQTYYYCS